MSVILRQHLGRTSYPGYPCTALFPKSNLPRGLQRLKELIRLEKGPHTEGIEYPEGNQEKQDVLGCTRIQVVLQFPSAPSSWLIRGARKRALSVACYRRLGLRWRPRQFRRRCHLHGCWTEGRIRLGNRKSPPKTNDIPPWVEEPHETPRRQDPEWLLIQKELDRRFPSASPKKVTHPSFDDVRKNYDNPIRIHVMQI